ncbi:RDD family protein [Streptomyces sp. NPDC056500]|uniref:RDD family protein n=1 Tax=Streptomyces sp. NPDC056500 TaxID=3345840 RepID=UPI0036C4A874
MGALATPPGDGSPAQGFYPDPSIPGYVRYWNGAAWVPGTSRPAPKDGEAMPAGPGQGASGSAAVPPQQRSAPSPETRVEETGPVFLDEDPPAEPVRQEPASVWQADTSRQTGFGGERDNLVSWGGEQGQRPPAQDQSPAADPAQGDPSGGALPGVRSSSTAADPAPATGLPVRQRRNTEGPEPQPSVESTMAIRALRARVAQKKADASPGRQASPSPQGQQPPQSQGRPGQQVPQGRQTAPASAQQSAPQTDQPLTSRSMNPPAQSRGSDFPQQTTVASGAGGGSASWPQQVHQLAQGSTVGDPPVVPWKPPVDDPFLQAAQAHAAARPAPLGKRLIARLIDTVVLGALVGGVAVPVGTQALAHIDDKIEAAKQSGQTVTVWLLDGTTGVHLAIVLGALLLLGVVYEAVPTAKWGRTLGKKVCGLAVVDIESHGPPTFGGALRRWLLYSGLGLLAIGVLNVLWCLFDRPWRQCWHDKAAHTFVTRA